MNGVEAFETFMTQESKRIEIIALVRYYKKTNIRNWFRDAICNYDERLGH